MAVTRPPQLMFAPARRRAPPLGRGVALLALGAPTALVVAMVATALPAPRTIAHAPVEQLRKAAVTTPKPVREAPPPPPLTPGPKQINAARRYLGTRAGVTGFAVIDSSGHLSGVNEHQVFITGSIVKAMLLVAYL